MKFLFRLSDVNDNAPTLSSPDGPNGCYESPLETLTMVCYSFIQFNLFFLHVFLC